MVNPSLVGTFFFSKKSARTDASPGGLFKLCRVLPYGCDVERNSPSALGSLTRALQVKFSQTYAARFPLTSDMARIASFTPSFGAFLPFSRFAFVIDLEPLYTR